MHAGFIITMMAASLDEANQACARCQGRGGCMCRCCASPDVPVLTLDSQAGRQVVIAV